MHSEASYWLTRSCLRSSTIARLARGEEHGQPDGRTRWIGPLDAMPPVRRNEDIRPGGKFARRRLVLEPQPRRPRDDQHPFGLVLIVPKALRRDVPPRHDPLNPHAARVEQCLYQLLRQAIRNVGK